MPLRSLLGVQLHHAETTGLLRLLKAGAEKHSLPLPYVLGIASRETNLQQILGDYRAGYPHGVGVMQIDVQHQVARDALADGTWKTHPEKLIDFGCALLVLNLDAARTAFPAFTPDQHLKIAASGYNAGMRAAILGAQHGDSDRSTTGHDYGRDVMTRAKLFEDLLK